MLYTMSSLCCCLYQNIHKDVGGGGCGNKQKTGTEVLSKQMGGGKTENNPYSFAPHQLFPLHTLP